MPNELTLVKIYEDLRAIRVRLPGWWRRDAKNAAGGESEISAN
jgi:hypothetical protein